MRSRCHSRNQLARHHVKPTAYIYDCDLVIRLL